MKKSEKQVQKNAIILAAGFGSRLVPLTFENPKGLIKVKNNESMVERQIRFLNEVGIFDITIVVGYMSDAFYKIKDKYKIKIIENKQFNITNSLYSLFLAKENLKNTYILNSDAWIEKNYFNQDDEFAYLTVIENLSKNNDAYEWKASINENQNIISLKPMILKEHDLYITGPSYFDENLSNAYKLLASEYIEKNELKSNAYWEECLFELIKEFQIKAYNQTNNVYEIDSLNNISDIDKNRKVLKNDKCLVEIAEVFNIEIDDIKDVQTIKKGLTNNSFSFNVKDTKYVYRSAGKGTENIIDRLREQKVYKLIKNFEYAERLYFYNPKTFSKISYFANQYKNVDQYNEFELFHSFKMIKAFHDKQYHLNQEFNIEKEIDKYLQSITKSIEKVKKEKNLTKDIYSLLKYLKSLNISKHLCHIDFIPDNLLINKEGDVVLIDYEYAGDADPMIDIAAFATSAFYNKKWLDKTISFYFNEQKPTEQEIIRIYSYMALLGYLWWLWTYAYMDKGDNIGIDYLNHMLNNAKFYIKLLKEKYHGIF